MSFRDWLCYLGIAFIVWVIASFLKEISLRNDPESYTVPWTLVLYVSYFLLFLALPVTLLASFGVELLMLTRIDGNDEESYKRGYNAGYDDGFDRKGRDSYEAWYSHNRQSRERFYTRFLAQKKERSKRSEK